MLRTFPDFYFSDGQATKNKFFFVKHVPNVLSNNLPGTDPDFYGFSYFDLRVSSADDYYNIYKLAILLYHKVSLNSPLYSFYDALRVYELAIILEKSCSYGDTIFTPALGRIFNDTFGSRKTASDVMVSPVDIYESICRSQNLSEEQSEEIDYGKAYSAQALISTGTAAAVSFASLDSHVLDGVRTMQPSFQVTDYAKSWTDVMKNAMLHLMSCVGFIDELGQESIASLTQLADPTLITDTVTYADVPYGKQPGPVIEPQPKDIFCEPFVNYNWNEGAQRFDGLIAIQQVHRAVWDASYTPGFSATDGERIWNWCHANLWARYHTTEQPTSELTDLKEVCNINDALVYFNAWTSRMLMRRITWPVYYDKAKTWHVGRHIYLNAVHQTAGANVEAVIEGIVKNKTDGYCELKLAFWVPGESPDDPYWQEVMYNAANGANEDIVESMTAQGGNNDVIEAAGG